jgi:hypothetical protein
MYYLSTEHTAKIRVVGTPRRDRDRNIKRVFMVDMNWQRCVLTTGRCSVRASGITPQKTFTLGGDYFNFEIELQDWHNPKKFLLFNSDQ